MRSQCLLAGDFHEGTIVGCRYRRFDAASATAAELPTYQLMGLSISPDERVQQYRQVVEGHARGRHQHEPDGRDHIPAVKDTWVASCASWIRIAGRPRSAPRNFGDFQSCHTFRSAWTRSLVIDGRPGTVVRVAGGRCLMDFASCCSRPHREITFFPPVFASHVRFGVESA